MKKDVIIGRPIRVNKQTLNLSPGKDYAEVVFIGDVHYNHRRRGRSWARRKGRNSSQVDVHYAGITTATTGSCPDTTCFQKPGITVADR